MAVIEEVAKAMATARMAKFLKRLCLNLADPLPRDGEMLAYFFKRVFATVLKPESHFDNLLFTRTQSFKNFGRLLAKVQIDHRFRGRYDAAVDQEIAEVRFFLFTNW